MPKKTVAKSKQTKKPQRKERQVMLPPAPQTRRPAPRPRSSPKKQQRPADLELQRLLSLPLVPGPEEPQDSWTTEREIEYLQGRLATAKEGLARHQNEVWAHQALIKTLEDSLETAMGELLVEEQVPSTKRSNR